MAYVDPAISPVYPEAVAAAERSLAALAIGDTACAFATNAVAKQFFNPRYRAIWEAAKTFHDENAAADIVGLTDRLAAANKLDAVGGYAWLAGLARGYPEAALAERYAEIVKNGWTTRELLRVTGEVPTALAAGASVQEVADRLRRFVDRIEDADSSQCVLLGEEIASERARIAADRQRMADGKAPESGLPSGLGLESAVPGGIPRDRVTLIFGETGTYKTAIKQWMADAIAASGKYVLDFTLEDSATLTAQRFLSRHTGIPYGRIAARQLDDGEVALIEQLQPLADEVASRTIVVGNVPATIEEAIRLTRHWARKVDLAAVFIDYVQLVDQDSARSEAEGLYKLCLQAQRAAHRDRIAWVLVSQMNRKNTNRDDKRPQLGDLYGSSGIQHTTKLVLGVYRPASHEAVPGKDSPWYAMFHNDPAGPAKYANALELWIRKNVAGESNVFVPLFVDRGTGRMTPAKMSELT